MAVQLTSESLSNIFSNFWINYILDTIIVVVTSIYKVIFEFWLKKKQLITLLLFTFTITEFSIIKTPPEHTFLNCQNLFSKLNFFYWPISDRFLYSFQCSIWSIFPYKVLSASRSFDLFQDISLFRFIVTIPNKTSIYF